jgi:flavin-dependent dehydrogenase
LQTAIDTYVDVAIAGGGPGGSAAAISCLHAGLSVALIESQEFPRQRPGESLHPGVFTLLRQLNVDRDVENANFLRYAGQIVRWGSDSRFQPLGADERGTWMGLQAIRDKFDAILLERAKALGALVLQPCRALSPIIIGQRVVGINSSRGPIRCAWLIDATGGKHWLGRKIAAGVYYASQRLIAHYGYASGRQVSETLPRLEADNNGWTWVAPIGLSTYAWTRLTFPPVHTRPESLPKQLIGCKPLDRTRAADVTWRLLPESAGPGYFLVGDAMAVVDPVSSHGVLKALMSGMQAAHWVSLVCRKRADEFRAIQCYREWCLKLFEHDVRNMRELYARLPGDCRFSVAPPVS